jgi:hypothetical protein
MQMGKQQTTNKQKQTTNNINQSTFNTVLRPNKAAPNQIAQPYQQNVTVKTMQKQRNNS